MDNVIAETKITLTELARAAGISPATALQRRKRNPDADLSYLLRPVEGPRNTSSKSLAALARKAGLRPGSVQKRYERNGRDREDALRVVAKRKNPGTESA